MIILGISCYYHDSAACIIENGEIIAATQEERFTRIKGDHSFPINSIKYCINSANIKSSVIDYVVFYDKPFLKFDRIIDTYLSFVPRGFGTFRNSFPLWIKDKIFQRQIIVKELLKNLDNKVKWNDRLRFSNHHFSHASSAFYPSPFKEAAILTLDGVGEWSTGSIAIGIGNKLTIQKEMHFPHSLGLLYSAFTYYLGFKVNSGEYKVMGLAPYGNPIYINIIKENLIDIKEDGSFQLNMNFFNYCVGLTMTNSNFDNLFKGPRRSPETLLSQREMDIAASLQFVTEEIILKICRNIASTTGQKNLCLAGGVALNCVANGKILKEKIFENVWVQPASGDAGGSIGAALGVYYQMLSLPRRINSGVDSMSGSYLGPKFNNITVVDELNKCGANFHSLDDTEIIDKTAHLLSEGKAVGWFSGRMEFGPRSLGNRSILADPRSELTQKKLNLKVKFRESFRPFAPSILIEDVKDFFDLDCESPYMLFVTNIVKDKCLEMTSAQKELFGIDKLNIPRSSIPAVTHVDYSARVQTVDKTTNPKFHSLITRFKEITGVPVLVNTSFNVRGEPVVCSPSDAYRCFMGTELDVLVIENQIMYKNEQAQDGNKSYYNLYELD